MTEYFAGIDIGSTMTKVVILDEKVIASVIGPTGPEQRHLANKVMQQALNEAGVSFEAITYIVATGYGRLNVPFADKQVTEISCHARGISYLFPQAKTIIDIGGQDSKAIKINGNGRVVDFVMNDKCAAGSGRFIEVIADTLGIMLDDMGKVSLESNEPAEISSICTIWAQQEVAASQAKGIPIPDLVAGVHYSLADRVIRMVKRLRVEREVVMTGGGAKNIGLVKALSSFLETDLLVPDEPLITGALGAAMLGKDIMVKAAKTGKIPETKKRILEKVKVF
jgi:predicted CoA-substrate-specific enzyme activase